ncbi:tctex1 domain-containing protein 1 [Exaiptasia diaphana]|uniref:Uncharacterized protein n=1 Tax=Exaiptasia diaphana TaxID=2652724 RepID=A0A913XP46_EXADI|nr:tctex1 domain-containing protein 1 [Exaiptasia diaphana]KXJ10408.1 Tctex1 domain-containing protein 1 [Exaiptasia diaphana]
MASDQKSSMTDSSTAQAAKGRRRGSLFEVGFPARGDRGSSIVSIPSMIPSHIGPSHQKVRYENTYKMEPDKRFNIHEVKEILQETLDESLQDVKKYDSTRCRALANTLSHTITERVKLLGFKRFKFVATVTIGEMKDQGIRSASRFLWNEKHDNWVDAVFTNPEIFAVAVVYAVYQE